MSDKRHLRLVDNAVEHHSTEHSNLLRDRPWSWLALVAASVVVPAIEAITLSLRSVEPPPALADTPAAPPLASDTLI